MVRNYVHDTAEAESSAQQAELENTSHRQTVDALKGVYAAAFDSPYADDRYVYIDNHRVQILDVHLALMALASRADRKAS